MNDLDLLRRLGSDLDAENGSLPAELRHRVLKGLNGGGRAPQRLRYWGPAAGLLTTAAAAVTVFAVMAGGTPPTSPAASPGGGTTEVTTEKNGERPDAVTILLAAATTARGQDTEAPDGSAYVYTQSKESHSRIENDGPVQFGQGVREAWLSVDGNHDGAVTPTGAKYLTRIKGCAKSTHPANPALGCVHDPAYRADAPTDKAAMVKYLRAEAAGSKTTYDIFVAAHSLLTEGWIRGASRAAIYDVLATLPGVEVVTGVTTLTGQSGVAVTLGDKQHSSRTEIIFDPDDHQLIGTRDVQLEKWKNVEPGTVMYENAILTRAVVPTLGVRPDGTTRKVPNP